MKNAIYSNNRFICDVMLGKLAKWLRIMGFDTLYFSTINDLELIKIAKQEQRVILTRDSTLAKSRKLDHAILIHSNNLYEQLKEVLSLLKINSNELFESLPRCVTCNGEIRVIDKKSILNETPEYVFLSKNLFLRCHDCGKIYWEGSHKKMIDKTIEKIIHDLKI